MKKNELFAYTLRRVCSLPSEPQFLALAAMQLELNECLLNGEYYPYSIIS